MNKGNVENKALCASAAEALATECRLRCAVAGALNLNRFADCKSYEERVSIHRFIFTWPYHFLILVRHLGN